MTLPDVTLSTPDSGTSTVGESRYALAYTGVHRFQLKQKRALTPLPNLMADTFRSSTQGRRIRAPSQPLTLKQFSILTPSDAPR